MFALTVRLPDELGEALRERARRDVRSINREIEFLLRQALSPSAEDDRYHGSRQSLVEVGLAGTATRRTRA